MTLRRRSRRPRRAGGRARRLLLVPALAFVVLGAPALAQDATPPAPRVDRVAVPGGAALTAGATPGWSDAVRVGGQLVGIRWSGDATARFALESRGTDGAWRAGGEVGVLDAEADPGSPDASTARARSVDHVSEPIWIGADRQVRLRLVGGSAADLTLATVQAPSAPVPSGAAGAAGLGGAFPGPVRGAAAFGLFALAIGAVLAAVALGWSPWRRVGSRRGRRARRVAALLLVVVGAGIVTACVPDPPPPPSTPAVPRPAFVERSVWGWDLPWNPDPECAPGPEIADRLRLAVVHHTVNGNDYGPDDSIGMVRAIWSYHVNVRGYCDIAYNFVVDRFGQIFEGRQGGVTRAVVAAHAGGFNRETTGMAFLGTHSTQAPSAEAAAAMASLLAWKLSVHRVDPALGSWYVAGDNTRWEPGESVWFPNAIVGHRDVNFTECPGDAAWSLIADLRAAVEPEIGWTGRPPTG